MNNKTGNVVIAGDKIYAGIDEDDGSEIPHSIVIEFENNEAMRKALRSGEARFTVFEVS